MNPVAIRDEQPSVAQMSSASRGIDTARCRR
jgi:hypothetical protein